ncbi:MAG: hypothetical protein ABIL09_13645 [Gemmatimonadota bacterium]
MRKWILGVGAALLVVGAVVVGTGQLDAKVQTAAADQARVTCPDHASCPQGTACPQGVSCPEGASCPKAQAAAEGTSCPRAKASAEGTSCPTQASAGQCPVTGKKAQI